MDEATLLKIMENREVMKGYASSHPYAPKDEGAAQPPLYVSKNVKSTVNLPKDFESYITCRDIFDLIQGRKSVRSFAAQPLSLGELSWLLWATQGEREVIGKRNKASMRSVPSAGARHPLETYIFVNYVEGLEPGLYIYLPSSHQLGFLGHSEGQRDELAMAFCGQTFFANSPVAFVWTAVPYRTEWRYSTSAQKYALLDAGHLCQALYMAAGSAGCGVCAIGAYYQQEADALLGLDGSPSYDTEQEYVVYAAAVGKL